MRDLGEADSNDVYAELDEDDDVGYPAICMSLLRLHRQGLLNRSGGFYSLTEKGRRRLEWLESEEEEEDEDKNEEDEEEETE